jgi:hypothetical protein
MAPGYENARKLAETKALADYGAVMALILNANS